MARDTGFPRADVENDFLRMRRRQILAKLAHKLSREPDDVNLVLPYDEVIAALGFEGEHFAGLKTIKLRDIVGSVDTRRDFDRRFRPTSARVRERWEQLALAQRPAIVRADVIDGVDVAAIVAQRDPPAVGGHRYHLTLGNLVDACDIDRLGGHVTRLRPGQGAAQLWHSAIRSRLARRTSETPLGRNLRR